MVKRKRTTVRLNKSDIEKLPNNMPVVYKIINKSDQNIYTGIAKKGRVKQRIKDHLSGGPDPIPGGYKVKIEQKPKIDDAGKSEKRIIKRTKPKYNIKGK